MFTFLVTRSVGNRLLVLALAGALVVLGLYMVPRLPVDVFPDLNRPTVTIMTEAEGLAPPEVEVLVSFPIETQMNGLPGVTVDGLDFFAVYEAAGEIIKRAREGGGPALLECKMIRMFGHFEGDQQTYRAKGELEDIRVNKDCIKMFSQRVTEAGVIGRGELDAIDREIVAQIQDAVASAKAAPLPTAADRSWSESSLARVRISPGSPAACFTCQATRRSRVSTAPNSPEAVQ
jgi:hypothetical protein